MQRPIAVVSVATAVVLLAGCSGSDDKSNSTPENGGSTTAATPSAPAVASFDPPKAFVAMSAFGVERTAEDNEYTLQGSMVGQTSLIAGLTGVTGRNIAAHGRPWTVPSAAASTTETLDVTAPMGVQLDGKDVVAIAYVQNDEGNGTQKAKGQVVFQWLDATDGKKVAEVTADLTPALGAGEGGDNVVSQAYDAATGQIVVGVGADGQAAAEKGGEVFTVYADPKTQKSTVIPFVTPAGVLNGVVAGAKGSNQEGAADGTIVIAEGATGKITKQTPTKQDYLNAAGSGGSKRAYLASNSYAGNDKYDNALYSVDIASGAVVQTKSQVVDERVSTFTCWSDQAKAVVCTSGESGGKEIIGFDDTTGKKTWGYTDESASRVVPAVTAAFHGIVYAQTEAQPVLMDAATGADVPTSTPTASSMPPAGATSTDGAPSQGNDPGSANGSDMSLYDGKLKSPTAVTRYGGAYLQAPGGSNYDFQSILIALAPTA
ncbi:hypothetical protein SSP24_72840 [Streptomyces spinoverrucosus]|uniref:Lipoprotein n=1 Tax=Streptomyces spinoverrucosus TaxID=284043 RepID=A0A4Y3VVC0_9ACTN|nr:hypothetical protein [Streptomyces spinoverrucosus]GEC09629.1 hypothetical protein SSP24_72840 [Streptomyces spinoverrucosus]GHB70495.1 hypothetical protein GCM10010397_45930 [Streptomyces spinoverrucosus]